MAKLDKYPIPRVEDLFVKLAGGKAFTKLDLSQAYLQLPLDEELKELVVVNNSKTLLTKDTLLVHFNPDLPVLLMCDASSYGIGAVLAHRMPDGLERPIGCVSIIVES